MRIRFRKLRPILLFIPLLLLAGNVVAQAPTEAEAYTKVRAARDLARRLDTQKTVTTFVVLAEKFLRDHPLSAQKDIVRLWLGDLLRDREPKRAFAFYRASTRPEAATRAADLAFRFEPVPRLVVDGWVGEPTDPTNASDSVTMLFFFSTPHPQTRRVLQRIKKLGERYEGKGLRLIGVAAVVDDHRNQTPAKRREWLTQRNYKFPVAIDRQRTDRASTSLALYRGRIVPWVAFLDRYGRIAWIGALELEGNALRRCEARISGLLREPGYATLESNARAGTGAGIAGVISLRTPQSVSILFRLRAAAKNDKAKTRLDVALRKLLPKGFSPDDGKRWSKEHSRFRYSFEQDRMVPKN